MEGGAGEGGDEGVRARGDGRDGGEGGWEDVFFGGEEGWGDEGSVDGGLVPRWVREEARGLDLRPAKPRHLGETIDDFAGLRPLEARGVALWPGEQIARGALENKVAPELDKTISQQLSPSFCS